MHNQGWENTNAQTQMMGHLMTVSSVIVIDGFQQMPFFLLNELL